MKIYTKSGDRGDTGLFGGPRVPKSDARVDAYGEVDELNAAVGAARAIVEGDLSRYPALRDEHAAPMLDISDTIASCEWDLEEAKVLHLELSRLMNAEVALLRDLGPLSRAKAKGCPVFWPARRAS